MSEVSELTFSAVQQIIFNLSSEKKRKRGYTSAEFKEAIWGQVRTHLGNK